MIYESNELYHYGVKGMKWGRRRAKMSEEGSKRTAKRLKKVTDLHQKYGPNQSLQQRAKIIKAVDKYDASAQKDSFKAHKRGDKVTAKSIESGRAYAHALANKNGVMSAGIANAANLAQVKPGEKFTYSLIRDRKNGTVNFNINGATASMDVKNKYYPN